MALQTFPNVSTINKTGSTSLSGAVTLTGGTGVSLTQTGQDITIGSSPAIGGPITSGTTGSVLFVGAASTIAEDNTRLFWDDTNNRLCVGTNTSVGKLTLVANAATDVILHMKGAVSQSGNYITVIDSASAGVLSLGADKSFTLYGDTQHWLGTSMTIKDVLARDIITASAVLLTISNVNLLIEQDIQVDGSIEIMDTVDLNRLDGHQLRILPDGGTAVGAIRSFTFDSTLTLDTSTDSYQFVRAGGEFSFTTGPLFGIPPVFFQYIPTIRSSTVNMTMGIAVYYNQASFIADGVVMTMVGNTWPAFWDNPQFSIANSGSYDASASYRGFQSTITVNAGAAFSQRTGYIVQNGGGSGTIATQRGYFCAALTKGGTANNPLYINAPDTANASGSMIDGNVTMFALAGSYGGGSRVMFMANATTAPSTNPTGGGILYITGGALTYRGSGGTVTTVAAA